MHKMFHLSFIEGTRGIGGLIKKSFPRAELILLTNCSTITNFLEKMDSFWEFQIDHTTKYQTKVKTRLHLDPLTRIPKIDNKPNKF
jgi:precorrin-6B methylase 2